jgi:tripartite-type tricarboxylate transporter receptor subunit TctC
VKRLRLAALLLAACCAAGAFAQAYPNRPIKMVVPFPPGGGFDGIARPFAERLSAALGQPVLVDNRPGAGGNVGTESAMRSPADGYTLLFANDYLATNPNLYKGLKYDPLRDFVPITMVGYTQMVITVNPDRVKATNARELRAESQQRPLEYGTPGVGTSPHLFGELYAANTGTRLRHIPYRGTAPALTDAIGGQIDIALVTVPAVVQQVKAGKLRAIAVIGGSKRSPLLPDAPTLAENGLQDEAAGKSLTHEVWYALFAPTGTPPEALKRLREASAAVLAQPDLAERLRLLGYEVSPSSPEAMTERVKSDLAKWKLVVERAKVVLE